MHRSGWWARADRRRLAQRMSIRQIGPAYAAGSGTDGVDSGADDARSAGGNPDLSRAEPVPVRRYGAANLGTAHMDGGVSDAAETVQRLRDGHAPRVLLVHQRLRAGLDHQPAAGDAEPEHPGGWEREPRLPELGPAFLRGRHMAGIVEADGESRGAIHAGDDADGGERLREDPVFV